MVRIHGFKVWFDLSESFYRVSKEFSGFLKPSTSEEFRDSEFQMMHERSFDAYRQVSALKIVVGDIRLSLTIVRDLAGRTSHNIWRTPTDDFKEIRTFDVQGRLVFYSLFYTLPHLPRSVSHFQSSSDSSATTVLYTEEGVPFAMNRDGFRYAIAVDDEGNMTTWFRLVGLSPVLLPPTDLHLTCQHSVCTRSLASFPSRLRTFSQLPSLSSTELLDTSFVAMYPSEDIAFAVEDAGFHELLVLTPNGHKASFRTLVTFLSQEVGFMEDSLTSLSMPHFTLVVSRGTAELRNGKTKIFVHFSSDADTVNKVLMEDFRRREGPTVWRAERKRVERGESTQPWTQQEKR
ncbi:unnamed protein product [Angiostrongylus costaricensis]|uniref:Sema domain-containing protein n=1 Tax=Angiostrongylus costaricensis TaxID=334426 RepID=A0A158PL79_ANGCS|nr:unnamed protein product [Angiostrongylus costaricensis]